MATLIETLRDVLETKIGIKVSLIEADLFSANVVTDSLKDDTSFPVFVLIPVMETLNERINRGTTKRKVSVFGFMLTNYEVGQTDDFDFAKVRPVIDSMKYLVDKTIAKLIVADITSKETDKEAIDKYKTVETYSKFDSHLFGVQVIFDWWIIESTPC